MKIKQPNRLNVSLLITWIKTRNVKLFCHCTFSIVLVGVKVLHQTTNQHKEAPE